jgi:tetratricopeptide (TPR) repeat protein
MASQATAPAQAARAPDRVVEAALDLRKAGRRAEALELLNRPGEYSQDAYILRGDLQLELGRPLEALGSYSTVIALDRENTYAQQKVAICLRQLEKWEPAADTLRKILEQDSYRDSARIALGECLLHLNRPEEALACFEACWSESAFLQSMFGKAVALHLLQRRDQAEAMYRRLLDLAPDCEEALANLIALSMEQYALGRVQRYAEQLIALRPDSVIALRALVVIAVERRDYETAARHYHRLLAQRPQEEPASPGEPVQYRLREEDAARLLSLPSTEFRSQ